MILLELEKLGVLDGEQRSSQSGVDVQFIVGVLNGFQRRADGHDFFAFVQGLRADQHVRYVSALKRMHIATGCIRCKPAK